MRAPCEFILLKPGFGDHPERCAPLKGRAATGKAGSALPARKRLRQTDSEDRRLARRATDH